jgi:hypothetical protein
MSLFGFIDVRLLREQMQRMRLDQVKAQVQSLLTGCRGTVVSVRDPAEQQLAAKGLAAVQKELSRIAGDAESRPDQALKSVKACQKNLHTVIAEARKAAKQWSDERARAEALLAENQAKLQAAARDPNPAGQPLLAKVEDQIEEARSLCEQGRYAQTVKTLTGLETQMEKANKASFDETVRRKVVGGLLATFQTMGFVVEGPNVDPDRPDGVVTMVGRMPSGKTARFEINLDGKLKFDLDGYEGRSCGSDLETIEKTMQATFGIQFGPPQITWKNPDKIAKGAKDLPAGSRRQGF